MTRVRLKEAQEAEARRQAAQEALAWEARQRALLEIRREVDEINRELAAKRAAWDAKCAERKRQSDLRWERFFAALKRGDIAGGSHQACELDAGAKPGYRRQDRERPVADEARVLSV
jgi:hypothetical protein